MNEPTKHEKMAREIVYTLTDRPLVYVVASALSRIEQEGWKRGYEARARGSNQSGCACFFDGEEETNLVSPCLLHKEWKEEALSRIEAETEARVLENAAKHIDVPYTRAGHEFATAVRSLSTKNLPTSPKSVEGKHHVPPSLIEAATRLHEAARPDDGPDQDAIIPARVFREFVDAHAGALRFMSKRAGWVLVPPEPTEEMIQAALDSYDDGMPAPAYRAMLQASPDTDLSVSGEVIGGWRPIETAPRKVEFRCLLGHEHSVVTGYWDGTMWVNERSLLRSEFKPTHWMPLPAAPDAPNDEGKP